MKIYDPYEKNVVLSCKRFEILLRKAFMHGFNFNSSALPSDFDKWFEQLELNDYELKDYNDQYGV